MKKMTGSDFDPLVRFFDGMAQTSWLSQVHNRLKELSGTWENKLVLDVGCATGRILLRGANEAKQVTGVDLSHAMVQAAKALFAEQKMNGEFLVGDAYDLPFENELFDIAISTCVLFLLPEPAKGMTQMLRVVKKGGLVVMLNPSLEMSPETAHIYCEKHGLTGFEKKTLKQWSNVSTSRHRYSPTDLNSFLTEMGAVQVEHEEVLDGLALITKVRK